MKVFCPNCGTQNEGMPGGRLTCKACTASFEVPREGGVVAQPPPPVVTPPPVMSPPQSSSPFPGGYAGPPPTGFGTGTGLSSSGTNPLAIASLVIVVRTTLLRIPVRPQNPATANGASRAQSGAPGSASKSRATPKVALARALVPRIPARMRETSL